jgi:hypothetical protein
MKTLLSHLIILISAILAVTCCGQKKQIVSESSLLGDWYSIKGGEYETYSFMEDDSTYIFVGAQDMHPVVFGTWNVDNNKLILSVDDGVSKNYDFILNNDTLILNHGEQIYSRNAPIEIRYPEVKILSTLSGSFDNLHFSLPRQSGIEWILKPDKKEPEDTIVLDGFEIISAIPYSSNQAAEISSFLINCGFNADSSNIINNRIGFWDNNQLVIILPIHKNGTSDDSVYLQISSGYIENIDK